MRWDDLPQQKCSIARSIAVIGDRWTLLILRDCFAGLRRFEQFQERLEISRTIIADRLSVLVKEQVLEKVVYNEKPLRFEYRLTRKGMGLRHVMMAILHWGDVYYAGASGPPYPLRHRTCGHTFAPYSACSHCKRPIEAADVEIVNNPVKLKVDPPTSSVRATSRRAVSATTKPAIRKNNPRKQQAKGRPAAR